EGPPSAQASAGPLGFWDVELQHPFLDPISWMHDEGLTTGFDDGTFRPTSPVSRQALAAVLWRNAGSPAVAPGAVPPFPDVPADSPFADAIIWGHGEGLVVGYA